ncbi:triphosphoribosyl-dephospho-CoA synthase [Bacillus sp. PK3_68]|uniref:triphosphoribosyl-dephospho-CoA synthase n=1 Tax=Bacillus sp. PK3_68 TaxID=2027408 RepID=UPI000E70E6CF|nr:triphosphoribosyl-dephospho-CoA synthase [Bacillus sp. PK3_68]RJS50208.1 triphosphoribosyl-dephospho-CoA synthase MdcB [Bacillus sp. PK3_68]
MNSRKYSFSYFVAEAAVRSLIEEAELTPKPGLVDQANTGAHNDLTIHLMRKSARSLKETFIEMADASYGLTPSQSLREKIALIGREGEKRMYEATSGANTHKGAIWALGLLVSAAAMGKGTYTIEEVVSKAGETARFSDRFCPIVPTNGDRVKIKYGVEGARGEAQQSFPHIMQVSLPMLKWARESGMTEEAARLSVLLSLIAHLDDTCILHRGGAESLIFAKVQANVWLKNKKLEQLKQLDEEFTSRNISPGGSADLLAATLFLDKMQAEEAAYFVQKEYESAY